MSAKADGMADNRAGMFAASALANRQLIAGNPECDSLIAANRHAGKFLEPFSKRHFRLGVQPA